MNESINRKLQKDEQIPYDLLLLADESHESIDRYIFNCEIVVMEEGGEQIGVYALQMLSETEAEIKNIAVQEKHQNKGFGKMLLRDAERRARDKGVQKLWIGTGNNAFKQLYIYQKAGFEMCEVKWNFFTQLFPEPIYEEGIQLKHMIMLCKEL